MLDHVRALDASCSHLCQCLVLITCGQSAAFMISHQRDMPPSRRGYFEEFGETTLQRCRGKQVITANHVGDAVVCIVEHHRELVRRCVPSRPDDGISEHFHWIAFVRAQDLILDHHASLGDGRSMVVFAFRESIRLCVRGPHVDRRSCLWATFMRSGHRIRGFTKCST